MELVDFLKESDPFQGKDVVILQRKTDAKGGVPTLFLATLFSHMKEQFPGSSLDVEDRSLPEIMIQLRMSFLGSKLLYFVKNTHTLSLAQKSTWIPFVSTYEGPHCLLLYDSVSSPSNRMLVVELPDKVDSVLYASLFLFLYPDTPLDPTFVRRLFFHQQTLSLEGATLLMMYQRVMGKNAELFFKNWFARIYSPSKPLYQLSQYFFAQQPQKFFTHWKECLEDYPEEFWVSYWSEQLWHALLFVVRARTGDFGYEQAYRLPYSFRDRDWSRYSPETLVKAHQFLYQFDYTLKNSVESHGLELMYHLFLHKKF
jgi:hypothetical protein